MTLSCYGREHNRLPSCSSCDMASYCKDAGDIKPLNTANNFDCDTLPAPEDKATTPELAISIIEIGEAAAADPDAWKIVVNKIRHPHYPLSKLATLSGFNSKQHADYHLKKFVRSCPVIFDALMFNRNYNHGHISKYYTEKPTACPKPSRKTRIRDWQPMLPGLL